MYVVYDFSNKEYIYFLLINTNPTKYVNKLYFVDLLIYFQKRKKKEENVCLCCLTKIPNQLILIIGPSWGKYYVAPIQFMVCYGAVVGNILLGGQCLKVSLVI